MPTLFDPIRLGAIESPNRILMAPLTRNRATRDGVPTPMMVEYYAQRADAGLIITEATGISRIGLGWAWAPGLWSREQEEGWKRVTEAVHAAGGRIVAQLWHMGRLVHPDFLEGEKPVSASATLAPGHGHTFDGAKPYAESRSMTLDEIARTIDDYARAATAAMAAGFDGVQLHAANGYLIDQFLRDGTNRRDDAYGGPIANRLRFLREATEAVIATVGSERTAVRLSPNDDAQGVADGDSETLFTAAAAALEPLGLAFLEMRASRPDSSFRPADRDVVPAMRKAFSGPMILNSDYGLEDGEAAVESGRADAIAYGRPFLANPDLPARFAGKLPLNEADPETFYTRGTEGYTDYPRAESV